MYVHSVDPVSTFNFLFKKQQIPSGILTQPSRYKRAETNLLADEKGSQQRDPGSFLLYIYIYRFMVESSL